MTICGCHIYFSLGFTAGMAPGIELTTTSMTYLPAVQIAEPGHEESPDCASHVANRDTHLHPPVLPAHQVPLNKQGVTECTSL
jgi:hypothetical protein